MIGGPPIGYQYAPPVPRYEPPRPAPRPQPRPQPRPVQVAVPPPDALGIALPEPPVAVPPPGQLGISLD